MTTEELRLVPGARVLVADGHDAESRTLAEHLRSAGHSVVLATDGEDALKRLRKNDPEVVLLDVDISRLNAYQLCERVKSHPSTRNLPVIMLVPPGRSEVRLRGLEVGVEDFLARPVHKIELLARVRSLVRAKRLSDQVETTESVIFGLARMVDEKASAAGSDTARIAVNAVRLAAALGLTVEDQEALRLGALLRDIGRIAVREEVLLKRGTLTDEEFDEIRIHPEAGERLCRPLRCADSVLPVIRHHQERWDGGGYPDGLRGAQIPLLARILAVADAYDAMLSPRPYRPALQVHEARQRLLDGCGSQWDPDLVVTFLQSVATEQEQDQGGMRLAG
jgi:putative two-component system response regulator